MVKQGDVRDILPTLDSESVQCVVTSPPYWGLRDYGMDGQIGLEPRAAAIEQEAAIGHQRHPGADEAVDGVVGGSDGLIDFSRGRQCDLGELLSGRRVDLGVGPAAGPVNTAVADQQCRRW